MYEIRAHIQDVQNAADRAIAAFSELAQLAYDLREACRFYTEGHDGGRDAATGETAAPECGVPASETGAGRSGDAPLAAAKVEHGPGADRGQPGSAEAPRATVKAKPEHILLKSRYPDVVPDAGDARAVLSQFEGPYISMKSYYDAFKKHCDAQRKAYLTRCGMRFLAYCCGYKKSEAGGTSKLVCPAK